MGQLWRSLFIASGGLSTTAELLVSARAVDWIDKNSSHIPGRTGTVAFSRLLFQTHVKTATNMNTARTRAVSMGGVNRA